MNIQDVADFISLVKDLIHLLSSQTGGVGELSDFLIYTAFSLSAGFLYRYHKSKKGALLAFLVEYLRGQRPHLEQT